MTTNYSLENTGRLKQYQFYYLCTLERYFAFREATEGAVVGTTNWYLDGVQYLVNSQKPDGSWGSSATATSPSIQTAFALMFLVRAGHQSIYGRRRQ